MDFIQELISSPWFKLIPIGASVITATFAIITFIKKSERINPVYIIRSTNIIRDSIVNIADLKVEYKGEAVKNFTVTNIALWNAGKKTIRMDDVASTDKIRIAAKNGTKIFDAKILHKSIVANKFDIIFMPDENIVEVSFEYLDYNHGAAIQIPHNGRGSADIEILGTIKTHGKIVSFENEVKKALTNDLLENPISKLMPGSNDKKFIFKLFLLFSLLFFVIAFFGSQFWLSTFFVILGLIYLIIAFGFRLVTNTPKEFEFIEE